MSRKLLPTDGIKPFKPIHPHNVKPVNLSSQNFPHDPAQSLIPQLSCHPPRVFIVINVPAQTLCRRSLQPPKKNSRAAPRTWFPPPPPQAPVCSPLQWLPPRHSRRCASKKGPRSFRLSFSAVYRTLQTILKGNLSHSGKKMISRASLGFTPANR